jgi:hypothetical protein
MLRQPWFTGPGSPCPRQLSSHRWIATTKVDVARSGDLAYEIGAWDMAMSDKDGKPVNSKGKYAVVWKKRCIVIGPAPQSSPNPSFAMKNIEHRLHRGICQFWRSGKFLLAVYAA